MLVKKYEVYKINLSGGIGREESKERPCVVVSNDIGNKYSDIITIMPLTSTNRSLPTHAYIRKSVCNGLHHDSVMQGEQVRTVDKKRICERVGFITDEETRADIDRAKNVVFD